MKKVETIKSGKDVPSSDMRSFSLKAKDRIVLSGLLPQKGDILTLRLVEELRKMLSFTEKENKDLGISVNGNAIAWIEEKNVARTFSIGPTMYKLIQGELKKLNDSKELTVDHIGLYDIFMDPTKE